MLALIQENSEYQYKFVINHTNWYPDNNHGNKKITFSPAEVKEDKEEKTSELQTPFVLELQKLFGTAFKEAETAKGKDLVLAIGNTRGGKSTSICYLMGCEMMSIDDELFPKPRIIVKDIDAERLRYVKIPEIGHTSEAQTLYAQPYQGNHPIVFCDAPGFLATGTMPERICSTVSTQIAIKFSRNIRALMVVIDFEELCGSAQGIKKLAEMLRQLLKEPWKASASMLFVFTKVPPGRTKKTVMAKIDELIQDANKKIKQSESLWSQYISGPMKSWSKGKKPKDPELELLEEFRIQKEIFGLIKAHVENIFVINVLDHGQSRDEIIAHLEKLKYRPIPKRYFHFHYQDSTHLAFRTLITKVVTEGGSVFKALITSPGHLEHHKEQKQQAEERIRFYVANPDLGNPTRSDKQKENDLALIRGRITETKVEQKNVDDRISGLERGLHELVQEEQQLATDELVRYWQHQPHIQENRPFYQVWPSKYDMEYDGIPYEEHRKRCTHGEFLDITDDKRHGHFKVTFKSEWGWSNGHASVDVWLKKRDIPDNKARIQAIQLERRDINTLLPRFRADAERVRAYDQELRQHELTLVQVIDDNNKTLQKSKQAIERSKREAQLIIEESNRQIQAFQRTLNDARRTYETNAEIYRMVAEVAPAVGFSSYSINIFLYRYLQYTQHNPLSTLPNIFTHVPPEYVCSISLSIMRDPVITKCSHTFDSTSLHFNRAEHIKCPTCREPVRHKDLISNLALKSSIETWLKVQSDLLKPDPKRQAPQEDINSDDPFLEDDSTLRDDLMGLFETDLAEAIKQSRLESKSAENLKKQADVFGLTCRDVAGDGNCFFHAVAYCLDNTALKDYKYGELRRITADHIAKNFPLYRESVDQEPNEFVVKCTEDRNWADHISVQALSRALNITIVVIHSEGDPLVFRRKEPLATICIGYERSGHYQALIGDTEKARDLINRTPIDNIRSIADLPYESEVRQQQSALTLTHTHHSASISPPSATTSSLSSLSMGDEKVESLPGTSSTSQSPGATYTSPSVESLNRSSRLATSAAQLGTPVATFGANVPRSNNTTPHSINVHNNHQPPQPPA